MKRKTRTTQEQHKLYRDACRSTLVTYHVEPTPQDAIDRRAAEIAIENGATRMKLNKEHLTGRSGWTGEWLGDLADFAKVLQSADIIKHLLSGSITVTEGEDWRASGERTAKDTQAVGNQLRAVYKDKAVFPYKVTVQGGGTQDIKNAKREVSFSLRPLTEAELAKALGGEDVDDTENTEEAASTEEAVKQ